MPVIVAGLRVASVSNISLVTVGSIIGIGGQGENARLTCPIKKQRPALRHPRRRRTQQFAAQDHLQSAARVSLCPWRIGAITAAALVLLHHEHDRTT